MRKGNCVIPIFLRVSRPLGNALALRTAAPLGALRRLHYYLARFSSKAEFQLLKRKMQFLVFLIGTAQRTTPSTRGRARRLAGPGRPGRYRAAVGLLPPGEAGAAAGASGVVVSHRQGGRRGGGRGIWGLGRVGEGIEGINY